MGKSLSRDYLQKLLLGKSIGILLAWWIEYDYFKNAVDV
jgi:hypothetical protein